MQLTTWLLAFAGNINDYTRNADVGAWDFIRKEYGSVLGFLLGAVVLAGVLALAGRLIGLIGGDAGRAKSIGSSVAIIIVAIILAFNFKDVVAGLFDVIG